MTPPLSINHKTKLFWLSLLYKKSRPLSTLSTVPILKIHLKSLFVYKFFFYLFYNSSVSRAYSKTYKFLLKYSSQIYYFHQNVHIFLIYSE